jgi:hypothetical protein
MGSQSEAREIPLSPTIKIPHSFSDWGFCFDGMGLILANQAFSDRVGPIYEPEFMEKVRYLRIIPD